MPRGAAIPTLPFLSCGTNHVRLFALLRPSCELNDGSRFLQESLIVQLVLVFALNGETRQTVYHFERCPVSYEVRPESHLFGCQLEKIHRDSLDLFPHPAQGIRDGSHSQIGHRQPIGSRQSAINFPRGQESLSAKEIDQFHRIILKLWTVAVQSDDVVNLYMVKVVLYF